MNEYTQCGTCPKCKAPKWMPNFGEGTTPPPCESSCGCSLEEVKTTNEEENDFYGEPIPDPELEEHFERAKKINKAMDEEVKRLEQYIKVPQSWLEELMEKSDEINQLDEDDDKLLKKERTWLLHGYISSAKTLIKYNKI